MMRWKFEMEERFLRSGTGYGAVAPVGMTGCGGEKERNSEVQGFRSSKVQEFNASRVQEFRSSIV
jgi:hypothetical protein